MWSSTFRDEDGSAVSAELNLEVSQGAARTVRIVVPASITVNTVVGANVADWEAREGTLTVAFLEPVEQKASLLISGETRLPREGPMDLPLLRLLDSERESGGVAVEVLGAGEIKNLRSQGLERTEAADLGATVAARQSPSLVAFRYRTGTGDRSLNVDVTRYTQQAVLTANIEEARYRVLISPDGKTLVEAHYAVRNNQRNFVRVTLPACAALWSASLAGRPVRPGRAPDGSLLLPLSKSRAGDDAPLFAVEVLYLTAGAAAARQLSGSRAFHLPGQRVDRGESGRNRRVELPEGAEGRPALKILVCMAVWINAAAAQVAAPLPAAGNVALPLEEYNRLIELSARPVKKIDAPPLPFVIQRADIKLVVAGGSATGTVQLEGEVFATGALNVPLIANMTLFDAHRQGGEPPMMYEGASHSAVLNGPGDFNVTLDVGLPVIVEAEARRCSFGRRPWAPRAWRWLSPVTTRT